MNRSSVALISVLLSLVILGSCSSTRGDEKARKLLAEVSELQDKESSTLNELMSRENIWFSGRLSRFPENRFELELVAREQVETLTRTLDLNQTQIVKLRRIRFLTTDSDFATYADLLAEANEKRVESTKLTIHRFNLISDRNIDSRKVLETRLAELNAEQLEIDKQMEQLDLKLNKYRNRQRK